MLELLAGALIFLFGYVMPPEPDNAVVLLEDPNGRVGTVVVTTADGTRLLSERNTGVEISSAAGTLGAVRTFSEEEIQRLFAGALAAQPQPPESYLLYFRTGTAELNDDARTVLARILADIDDRVEPRVIAIGHSDRVGAADVNARLALARAEEVRVFLEQNGVPAAIITAVSHGENDPLVPTADGVDEPRNRRVEVLVR